MENRILIDASVIVEIVKDRYGKQKCQNFIATLDQPLVISALTVSICWHYGEQKNADIQILKQFLELFEIVPLTESEISLAYELWENQDFEDALQIASAVLNNCSRIITLDKRIQLKYGAAVTVVTI